MEYQDLPSLNEYGILTASIIYVSGILIVSMLWPLWALILLVILFKRLIK